jgi:RNA recognition motif-containing protein
MVCVKMQGLPFRASVDEVTDFFRDYKYVDGSVIFGLGEDGRKNGFGAVLFEDDEQASTAAEAMNK